MSTALQIPIEKNFYELVEKQDYLKHIIYGDSVVGTNNVVFQFQGEENKLSLDDLWDFLSSKYEIETIENKEYIFFKNDEFLIQNYDFQNDEINFARPKYFMRHKFNGEIYKNYLNNTLYIGTTLNHSYIEIDVRNKSYKTKKPEEIQVLPVITCKELQVPQKFALMYGIENKFDYYGIVKKSSKNKQLLFAIRPYKICKKHRDTYDGYVYDFEVPSTHIFIVDNVLVHNTDSLFIEIPSKPDNVLDKVKIVNKASKDINELIVNYNTDYLLPRCGFSSDRNETNFKEGATRSTVKKHKAVA